MVRLKSRKVSEGIDEEKVLENGCSSLYAGNENLAVNLISESNRIHQRANYKRFNGIFFLKEKSISGPVIWKHR